MSRYLLLIAVVLMIFAHSALADCTTYTIIEYQTTEYSDGSTSVLILGMTHYTFCDVYGAVPPPPAGGSGSETTPPTVTLSEVNTADPYQPIVSIDVTSNDSSDQVLWVILEVNGIAQDFINWAGNNRYQLHLPAISAFSDGSVTLNGKACTGTGICGQDSRVMIRSTPAPNTAAETINAAWLEEDEDFQFSARTASYWHGLRQMYTLTTFTCSEVGENSHVQIKDSLATISGHDPMPMWSASLDTHGTINSASYYLLDATNPFNCTYPVLCSSKGGSAGGAFGYSPWVHEQIGSFVIDGHNPIITGGSLDINSF